MRSETRLWIWIIVLFLLLTGTISLGDIFSLFFTGIGLIIMLFLIVALIFSYRVRRAQRQAEEQGQEFKGYTWNFGGYQNTSRPSNPDEGKVRVKSVPKSKKRVSDNVGEYVDFKEE
ncbi:MAG: DUF4834 family protein [Tidjanibacter sp.]|nr:DUF4834 family protein [Tidjanibacter sp.]